MQREDEQTYSLDHGLCPLRGAVLHGSLQHPPEDVDQDVAAQQAHDAGEGRAEGGRHWGAQGWTQRRVTGEQTHEQNPIWLQKGKIYTYIVQTYLQILKLSISM